MEANESTTYIIYGRTQSGSITALLPIGTTIANYLLAPRDNTIITNRINLNETASFFARQTSNIYRILYCTTTIQKEPKWNGSCIKA